jgi:hypothetical protein
MDHLLLAIKGSSTDFPRIAEDIIRKKFPSTLTFKVKLPVVGQGMRDATVTLGTVPHRVGVSIDNDGYLSAHLEIAISLIQIDHDLMLNDIFPAGQNIPTTTVPMKATPPLPLAHKFDPPLLIGVPAIDVRVKHTTQTVLDGNRIQLNAEIDPGQIIITPNLAGLLQVLIHNFISGITAAIQGAYGHTFLADILVAVLNFLDILLQHVLELLKIPEKLFSALVTHLAAAIESTLLQLWSALEVPMFAIPRTMTIASAVTLPSGKTKSAVALLISTIEAHANIVHGTDVAKEFIGSMNFASR